MLSGNVAKQAVSLFFGKDHKKDYLRSISLSEKEAGSVEDIYKALESKKIKIKDMGKFYEFISKNMTGKVGNKKSSDEWSSVFDDYSIKDSEVFIKFVERVCSEKGGKKGKISSWFSKFDMGSIKNANKLFCHSDFDLLDNENKELSFSWYHLKIYFNGVKNLNELADNSAINFIDDNGKPFDFSWYWYQLDDQSIKNWDNICTNPNMKIDSILKGGYLTKQWCCKFSEQALRQAVKKNHFQSCYLDYNPISDKVNWHESVVNIENELQKEQGGKTVSGIPKQEVQTDLKTII